VKRESPVEPLDFFKGESDSRPKQPKSPEQILAVFDYLHAISKAKKP
jgi:hypothetical protein